MSVNLLPAERSLGVGMASNPKNPFVCNICKKTYTRLDHLGRHYRTHTSEKPFTCDQCGKGFTRVDLLRRHRTNHLDRSHPAKQARARAQRATKACAACAASKLKCAETRPCHRCAAKNIPCLDEKNTQEPRGTVDSNGNDASRVGAGSVESQHAVEHDSSPILPSGAQSAAAQLLTPFTGSYGGSTDTAARYDLPDLPMDDTFGFDDTLMGDFLRDIVYPNPDFFDSGVRPSGPLPDVLDFGFSEFLDVPPSFYDRDPQPTAHFDITHTSVSRSRSGAVTPTVPRDIEIGQQAFKDSFWLWTPSSGDNRAAEQRFLTIAEDRVIREARNLQTPATLNVSLASRDRLLSLILGTCEPSIQRHVLSRFPSGELISSILTSFVALRFDAVGWWIHAPSLHINQEHESFLAGILAAAAVESHHPDIRRLGFAVQEAARIGVADRFEEDNTYTRDLRVLQAFALQLHAGFWSGGKRRMEIAESFTYPLITMLRRAGQFRKRSSTTVPEQGSGDDSSAEDLWREWIRMESLKRVAFHVLIQDSTISMSLLTNPLLFQAEFQLELPCSPALWTAASADEWKIAAATTLSAPLPTIRDALSNLYVTVENRNSIDIQLSLELIVSSLWSRVWQFHQMRAMVPLDGSGSNSLTANSLHQELVLGFKYIKMRSEEWGIELSPMVALKLEICLMHLHVSLEDIQVLGGKEGEIEARKTVPQLQTWSQSREARGALHHAGQALRAAAKFESGTLRGFAAVAVYHASLVLWAFGVLNDPGKTRSGLAGPAHALIQIDAEDSLDLQRFLMLGQGSPCIADYTALRHRGSSTSGGIAVSPATILVTNPLQIMNAIAALLTTGTNGSDDRGAALPIVANLSRLMRSLGKAAAIMKQTGIRSDS